MDEVALSHIRFKKGQRTLSAREMNSIVNNLQRLKTNFTHSGKADLEIGSDGILVIPQDDTRSLWVGTVVCAGPGGEDHNPNPTDNNTYWVERGECNDTDPDAPMTVTSVDIILEVIGEIQGEFAVGDEVAQEAVAGTAIGIVTGIFLDEDDHANDMFLLSRTSGDFVVSATLPITGDNGFVHPTDMTSADLVLASNMGESVSGTHLLPIGQQVEVMTIVDQTDPPRRRSFFTLLPLVMAVYIGYSGSACGAQLTDGHAAFYAGRSEGRRASPSQDDGMVVRDHIIFKGKLYAAVVATFDGDSYNLAEWDPEGDRWVGIEIPEIDTILTMLVHNDHLYIGGNPTSGNGLKTVQRFEGLVGSTWEIMTFPSAAVGFSCRQMLVWNGSIYACGDTANAAFAEGVAKLDGTTWSALGAGIGDEFGTCWAQCLEVHDDGSGEKLYVGGEFDQAEGGTLSVENIAAWDGANWTHPGEGISVSGTGSGVRALRSYDDGDGALLYAGGLGFDQWTLLAWTGQAWIPKGELLISVVNTVAINSLDVHVGKLIVGGYFHRTGGIPDGPPFLRIAKYDSASALFEEMDGGFNDTVYALAKFATEPVAVGRFLRNGTNERQYAAQWNGTSWITMGENTISGPVFATAELDSHTYIGGDFLRLDLPNPPGGSIQAKRLARYNGEWASVGDFNGPIYGMSPDESGGKMYIVGQYDVAGGSAGHLCIVEYDLSGGASQWNTICSSITDTPTGFPRINAVYKDTTTGDVYVAGRFTNIDGVAAVNVAYYDGTWHAMGNGVDAEAWSIEKYSGKWYFGGEFKSIDGGTNSDHIARWTGAAWEAASTFNAASFLSPVYAIRLVNGKLWVGTLWNTGAGYFHVIRQYNDPNWETVANQDGTFSNDILDILDTGGGDAVICGRFTPQSDHEKAFVDVVALDKAGFHAVGGGVGIDPIGGPLGLDSGDVYTVRSLQEPGRRCRTLFVGGAISLRSSRYARGICGLSTRGLVPLQGGFNDGRSDFVLGARNFLHEGTRTLVVGNFSAAYNDFIAPADVDTVEKTVVTYYAAWWTGQYWEAVPTGLGTVPDAVEKYLDEYYVCGVIGFVPMKSSDAVTDTWSVVHADFGSGGEHHCMKVFGDLLFIGGNMFIAPSGNQHVVTYDGVTDTIADVSPSGFVDIRKFVIAEFDLGPQLYCCGDAWDGTPIRRWTGSAFVDVAGGCTGTAYSMTYVPDDLSPCIVLCGTFTVNGVACSMAKWNGSTWEQLGNITGYPVVGNVYGIHYLNNAVYLVGAFPSITDPADVHPVVETPNVAVWTPGGWWKALTTGGINGQGLAIG